MTKLIDMKRKMKELEETNKPISKKSHYPYGLKLSFEEEDLKKLGISITEMKIGDMINFVNSARITSISSNKSEDYSNNTLSLQIEKMGLSKPSKKELEKYK